MIKISAIICLSITLVNLYGQISERGVPKSNEIYIKNFTINSISCELNLEKVLNQPQNDSALDVGVAKHVNIDLLYSSSTIKTDKGKIYLYQININNAIGIGVDFSNFYIPSGCQLFAYDKHKLTIMGAYTSRNNKASKKFSIQPINCQVLILEYYQPDSVLDIPNLIINRIGMFYREIYQKKRNSKTVGECFEDVHCENEIDIERAVFKWQYFDTHDSIYYHCSCALINQDVISNDVKPYTLTANHCGKDAELSTAIFYFNFQNPGCNIDGGTPMFTLVGANKISKRAIYDMFLMELDNFPPPDYNVYLAGWDRKSSSNINKLKGIHHPHGYRKSISLGSRKRNTNPNFWRVEWDRNNSPTAHGSSGSPLFDDGNRRILGWLSYGNSECNNTDGKDKYGKFRKGWSGPSSTRRLRDWLDPDNNNKDNLDGRNPCFDNLLIQNRTFYSAQEYYQPENEVVVQAKHTIETQGNVTIKSGSEYIFRAGDEIILSDGFVAEAGCSFVAEIVTCSGSESLKTVTDKETDIYKIEFEEFKPNIKSDYIQVHPNPFESRTTIEYSLKEKTLVTVDIFNLQGVKIKTVINNKLHPSGIFQVDFFAKNLKQGIYICLLKTNTTIKTIKLIISNK